MVCSVHYDVLGTRFSVQAPDENVTAAVRRLFPAYETPAQEPSQSETLVISIERHAGELVIRTPLRSSPQRSAGFAGFIDDLEYALTEAFLAASVDRVHLHASGCVTEGGAVLALGGAGAGKSTLAASWSLAGLPVLGDDVVFLDREGCAEPFKRQFKVDPKLLADLGGDPTATTFWEPGGGEAWFDPAVAGGWAPRSPVRLVAFVTVGEGAALDTRRVEGVDGLNRLLHSRLDSGARGTEAFEWLAALAQRTPMIELHFGDAAEAARTLAGSRA